MGRRGRAVDKHATTNVHKTSRLLQMSGEKEAEEMIHHQSPLLSFSQSVSQSQLGNSSLASDENVRGWG